MPQVEVNELRLQPRYASSNPRWWGSTAFVNDDLVVKFAWSEVRATALHREGVLLQRLPALAPELVFPELISLTDHPVLVVTKVLAGEPLSWGAGSDLRGDRLGAVSSALAGFMSRLHALRVGDAFGGLPHVEPTPQADTSRLRARYGRRVDERRGRLVHGWCDWVDDVLGRAAPEVVVHGDLHGFNQLWDIDAGRLVAVLDLEECGPADRHFDFRYLPGNSASTDLVLAVVGAYERQTGLALRLERIMAWHVLTVLGDALWRTEADVELPGGGNASSWVDDLRRRLDDLDLACGA